MGQIILLEPRLPTTSDVLRVILKQSALLVLAILILDATTRMFGNSNALSMLLNMNVWPYIRYILWAGGVTATPMENSQMTAMATLLSVFLLFPLSHARLYARLGIHEFIEQTRQAPSRAPNYDRWFIAALSIMLLIGLLRGYMPVANWDFQVDIYLLTRLAITEMGAVFIVVCLYLGMSQRRLWLKLNPPAPAPAKKPVKLTVVETPKAQPTDRALLVALVAELIQFCGQHNRAPTSDELAQRLLPLLRAAQLTRSATLVPGELEQLCGQTLALFNKKKLASLRDVKTACSLFQQPKTGAVDLIVGELSSALSR